MLELDAEFPIELSADEERRLMQEVTSDREFKAHRIQNLLDADAETADAIVAIIEDEDGRRVLRAFSGALSRLEAMARLDAKGDAARTRVPQLLDAALYAFYEATFRRALAEQDHPFGGSR
jgi:hypothetical protein